MLDILKNNEEFKKGEDAANENYKLALKQTFELLDRQIMTPTVGKYINRFRTEPFEGSGYGNCRGNISAFHAGCTANVILIT